MSFSLANIVNSFLNVRNKVKDSDGNWVDERKIKETQHMAEGLRVDISRGITVNVFEVWGKKVIIDTLEFGTDSYAYPSLHVDRNDQGSYTNQLFHETRMGSNRANAVPGVIAEGSSYFNVERDSGDSKVWLKKPVILPEGGRLTFGSTREEDGRITYKVYWREIEE